MSTKGFTFTCPNLDQLDGDSESFFKANPSGVYNPFPQIARRDDSRHARTQPLVRTRYEPRTNVLLKFDEVYVIVSTFLEFYHEKAHIDSDDAPAKSFARFIQAQRFKLLSTIIWSETWDIEVVKAWSCLCEKNKLLSSIADRIVLSEELLATAQCFIEVEKIISDHPRVAHWQPILKDLEEAYVEYFTKLSSDFRTLYFETIKKVVAFAKYAEDSITSTIVNYWIYVYLEGLMSFEEDDENWALDSHQQCLQFAEYVKEIDSPEQFLTWIQKVPVMSNEAHSHFTGLGFQYAVAVQTRETEAGDLWQMSRARKTRKGHLGYAPKLNFYKPKLNIFDSDRPSVVLYPRLEGSHWHIHPGELLFNKNKSLIESSKYIKCKPVHVALKMEALLEQLEERDGICCPYYRYSPNKGESCPCDPSWRLALMRILQWAREGKFGSGGTWRDLPPECCSGV